MINRSNHQAGATLITVLILLVLMTIIGLYAIRNSILNLKLATNAQVQTLLMQTSDVALDHLEKNFNSNEATNLAGTPVGQVLLDGNQGKELQFCFKPTEIENSTAKNNIFFNLGDFRIIERSSSSSKTGVSAALSGDISAVCNPATMFSISRKAIVTQIAVVNPDDPAVEMRKFELTNKNTDLKADVDTKRVRVIATSFAPAMAPSVTLADINTCLGERVMDELLLKNRAESSSGQVKVETLHECLNKLGVPLNTQVAEYVVRLTETKS
jgi:Tfp pilus assembly protein PilX